MLPCASDNTQRVWGERNWIFCDIYKSLCGAIVNLSPTERQREHNRNWKSFILCFKLCADSVYREEKEQQQREITMENYTSDSSDSDLHTIDYQNRNLTLSKAEDTMLSLFSSASTYAEIETVILYNNKLTELPLSLMKFSNLHTLDVSNNCLTTLNIEVFLQCPLKTFIAKNNQLTNESLPKTFTSKMGQLRELNLSGNQLTHFPAQILALKSIKYLYLNANYIRDLPKDISKLSGWVLARFDFRVKLNVVTVVTKIELIIIFSLWTISRLCSIRINVPVLHVVITWTLNSPSLSLSHELLKSKTLYARIWSDLYYRSTDFIYFHSAAIVYRRFRHRSANYRRFKHWTCATMASNTFRRALAVCITWSHYRCIKIASERCQES